MKTKLQIAASARILSARDSAAFTLPEALISASLFVLLLGGVVGANLFGMRMFQLTETKLKAGDGGRKAVGLMTDEIRTCRSIWVGDVTNGVFVGHVDGERQAGSALLLQPTTNATNLIIYFLNRSDRSLRRSSTATATTTILAQTVTNNTVFAVQDCLGNVLTNNQANRVIHFTLEFFRQQPWLPVADYAKLETSVTRRRIN